MPNVHTLILKQIFCLAFLCVLSYAEDVPYTNETTVDSTVAEVPLHAADSIQCPSIAGHYYIITESEWGVYADILEQNRVSVTWWGYWWGDNDERISESKTNEGFWHFNPDCSAWISYNGNYETVRFYDPMISDEGNEHPPAGFRADGVYEDENDIRGREFWKDTSSDRKSDCLYADGTQAECKKMWTTDAVDSVLKKAPKLPVHLLQSPAAFWQVPLDGKKIVGSIKAFDASKRILLSIDPRQIGKKKPTSSDDALYSYHPNGLIAERTSLRNGKPHGKYESFNEQGKYILASHYKNGILDSLYTVYDTTGIKTAQFYMLNGDTIGMGWSSDPYTQKPVWSYYGSRTKFADGSDCNCESISRDMNSSDSFRYIQEERAMVQGKRDGLQKEYYEPKSAFAPPKIKLVSKFKNDRKDGIEIEYDKKGGFKKWERVYKHGTLMQEDAFDAKGVSATQALRKKVLAAVPVLSEATADHWQRIMILVQSGELCKQQWYDASVYYKTGRDQCNEYGWSLRSFLQVIYDLTGTQPHNVFDSQWAIAIARKFGYYDVHLAFQERLRNR